MGMVFREKEKQKKDWSDAFRADEAAFAEAKEYNKKIYDKISIKKEKDVSKYKVCYGEGNETSEYPTPIEACVSYAMETGNHAAFVKYYTEMSCFREDIYREKYHEILQNVFGDLKDDNIIKNLIKEEWKSLIVRSNCWRWYKFEYETRKVEDQYSQSSYINWFLGNKPNRDAIVQIGYCLGLNNKEVDELLVAAGYNKLYVMDVVDAVSMYYLGKLSKKTRERIKNLQDVKNRGGDKKEINRELKRVYRDKVNDLAGELKNVKTQINQAIQKCFTSEESEYNKMLYMPIPKITLISTESKLREDEKKLLDELADTYDIETDKGYFTVNWKRDINEKEAKKRLIEGVIKGGKEEYALKGGLEIKEDKTSGKLKLYRFEEKEVGEFAYMAQLGSDIDVLYQKLGERINKEQATFETDFVTKYYKENLDRLIAENASEGEFLKFIENGKDDFTQRHYGYLKRTKRFVEDADAYKKNLYITDCSLRGDESLAQSVFENTIPRQNMDDEFSMVLEGEPLYHFIDEKIGNQFCYNFFINNEHKFDDCITAIKYIWNLTNVLDENVWELDQASNWRDKSTFSVVANTINGRNALESVRQKILLQKSNNEEKKLGKVFQFNIGDKSNAIRFALATGKEDELFEYLKLVGFWSEEMKEVAEAILMSAQEGKQEKTTLVFEKMFDKIDSLIIYILKYRDELIQKWQKTWATEQRANMILTDNIKKSFPTIRLTMEISRDIEFVLYYFVSYRFPESVSMVESVLNRQMNYILYPVRRSNGVWFESKLEKCFIK